MKATMNGANFNRIIAATRAFASGNTTRPQNNLIQLHFCRETASLEAFALDGYRAMKETSACYTVDEDFMVLVSAPPLKANGEHVVEIEQDGEYAYISFGNVRFRTKRPEGKVLDVNKVLTDEMKKEGRHRVGLNVDYLLDACKSIKASGTAFRKAVIIEIGSPLEPVILRTDRDNPRMVMPVRIREDT